MKDYNIMVYGFRANGDRVEAMIAGRAQSPRMAIVQVSGIEEAAITWQDHGFLDDVTIYGYEVLK
jgi:hypothetical protein